MWIIKLKHPNEVPLLFGDCLQKFQVVSKWTIACISGAGPLFLAGVIAFVSDTSTIEKRSLCVFLMDLFFGISSFLSNTGFGYVISSEGYTVSFVLLASLSFVNLLFTKWIAQESVVVNKESKQPKFLSLHNMKASIVVYIRNRNGRWQLIILLVAMTFCGLSDIYAGDTVTYHLLDKPQCFTSGLIGLYTGIYFLIKALGGVFCLLLLQKKIGDLGLLLLGFCSSVVYQALLPAFHSKTDLFIGENNDAVSNFWQHSFRKGGKCLNSSYPHETHWRKSCCIWHQNTL